MSNTNLINDIVLPESMVILRNNTAILNSIGAHYDDNYKFRGAKAGSTINLRTAQEFTVRETMTADVQDVEQKSVPLPRATVRGIDMRYSSAELTQDVEGFKEYRLKPAMAQLAAKIDAYIYETVVDQVYQAVTLPVTAVDVDDILDAGVILDNMGAGPRDGGRMVCLSPKGMKQVVSDTKGLFNSSDALSKNYKDGIISVPTLGFNFASSANVSSHTVGAQDGAYQITSAPAEGATSMVVKAGSGTIKKGDIFNVAAVYEVNPLTKVSTGRLKQFVVTLDSVGGNVTINTSPAIYSTGAYQNVDSMPAADDAVTFLGTASTVYQQGLAYHPNAFAVGFCDLETPTKGVVDSGRFVEDGVSISAVQWFDGYNRQEYLRFDVLFGAVCNEPRAACRIYIP